jgi:hypothetical protein
MASSFSTARPTCTDVRRTEPSSPVEDLIELNGDDLRRDPLANC